MGEKIGRNTPCPCGSGIKYKKCCLNNAVYEFDIPYYSGDEIRQLHKDMEKESRRKQCLHPDKDNCTEKIIHAHSIQNNKILKKISDNGMVYMPYPKPDEMFDEVISKRGRKEATTFTGFCGYHDKVLFAPIEDHSFDKSPLHVFLYTYRCFAVEYHKRQEQVDYYKRLKDKFGRTGNSLDDQFLDNLLLVLQRKELVLLRRLEIM